jgi:RNA polymerase sigma factor (sigma-70 family)
MVAGMSRTHPVSSLQADQYFQQFTQGDEIAFGQLYKQFYKPLLRYGLKIVSEEFVVNSAIQEAFLKAWSFRERMTSMLHTYRFLRLNVSWKCYNYYRHPNQLHQRIIYTDNIDNYTKGCYFADQEHEEQIFAISEERLQAIDKVIPYLPTTRKTIFTLYFKYGLTHRQIAKRFSCSSQFISAELQKGLEDLKKVIHTAEKLDTPVLPHHTNTHYPEYLQGELLQLFRLRYESKWSFENIAAQMNLPLAYVQQEYIKAHRLLNQMHKSGR